MIVEHFLRNGYYESAERLAERGGIKDLTNVEIFQTCREVEEDLSNHSTLKCTLWCNDNKSKLRKINSNIEFKLSFWGVIFDFECAPKENNAKSFFFARKIIYFFSDNYRWL